MKNPSRVCTWLRTPSHPFTHSPAQQRWASAGQVIAACQAVAGITIFFLSWAFFYEFTEATGLLLGACMVAAGAVGWAGGRARSGNLANLHVLATLLALLLSFNFIGQVVREVHVDCGLAELYLKNKALETRISELRHTEAMHSVYARMSELEDMLEMAQRGAVKSIELKAEQDKLRHLDASYIASRLAMLRAHAQEAMDGILQNPALNATVVNGLSQADKDYLRKRLDAADKVIERVRQHHEEDGKGISLEEYQELLGVLTDATVFSDKREHPDLVAATSELPNMGAAMRRQQEDRYQDYLPGSAHHEIQSIERQRTQRRLAWEERVRTLMSAQGVGLDAGTELAKHCVKEARGHSVTLFFGLVAIALQLCSAYTSLCLGMRLSVKGE